MIGFMYGFYALQFCARNSNGYPMGVSATPDAVSNGTVHHAYKLTGPVSCTPPGVSRQRFTSMGGMKHYGAVIGGITDVSGMTLTLSHFDPTFDGYVNGYTADATNAGSSNVLSAPNLFRPGGIQGMLLLTRGFSTTAGANRFMTHAFPNVTIRSVDPEITQSDGQNTQNMTYTVEVNSSTRMFNGMLLSATSLALTDNTDFYQRLETPYQIGLTTYVDDASATSFVVGYRPATADNDNTINVVLKNGVNAASSISGLSVTTGATTHTAGTAGDIWTVTYGTNWTAI